MLQLIGFDGDDTLWHSEGYYRQASEAFAAIMGRYVDLGDRHVHDSMLATEQRNLQLFGYGAKGMALSMVETAIAISEGRVSAADIHRLVELGKTVLQHPVELLPGIREAVEAVAGKYEVVLITKGDLFHQEKKVAESGLADLFRRIEIVSEKNAATYRRVLGEFALQPAQFAMVGNSLRSDIEPVLRLGGWGVHMPYHVTWAHELENGLDADEPRLLTVDAPAAIPAAVERLRELAAA
ncbi:MULTISPECIES: HAD family hydrolase [unclassified Rhodanobacter]|uniref:HAD family hydrolase n=1 Tax=unclassified Rhodanobacter TaxID=2621553 RepID=UPI0007A9FFC4|nr:MULTISPECIES: HAD family hydrolase [unclassified Rhodanobacter]KZC17944.1 haloacid dehalogenase [Rhodanobacter sp. FW104-R8]KZC25594.1 haloacid dehalogenase [Rhodanobacter sp. FW510-T8]KZC32797.1 haloacid dehalogenase [Rhodanobacter sp. FW510-R10]